MSRAMRCNVALDYTSAECSCPRAQAPGARQQGMGSRFDSKMCAPARATSQVAANAAAGTLPRQAHCRGLPCTPRRTVGELLPRKLLARQLLLIHLLLILAARLLCRLLLLLGLEPLGIVVAEPCRLPTAAQLLLLASRRRCLSLQQKVTPALSCSAAAQHDTAPVHGKAGS